VVRLTRSRLVLFTGYVNKATPRRVRWSMREVFGDIWTRHAQGHWIAITTNGSINSFGQAVLGRGVARQAVQRHPELPRTLGAALKGLSTEDLPVVPFPALKLMAFPVKWQWYEPASEPLIVASCRHLLTQLDTLAIPEIYLVRPGCGSGGLSWTDVRPLIASLLDDRVVIIDNTRIRS
jgi:hypothetical protein